MCAVELESMTVVSFPQMSSTPGEMCAVELGPMAVMSFPWTSSTPGEMSADELDFPRASFPLGESCTEDCTVIPQSHHLVTVVSRIMLDICLSAWTVLISPSWCGEIWDIAHWKRLGQYLIPLDFVRIVLILCYFCRVSWRPADHQIWIRRVLLTLLRIRYRGRF